MTISLDYRLSPTWNRETAKADLSSVDASDLHYRLFLGDIEFLIDGADFSARWGWVPVLGFAAALRSIVRSLPETQEELFEFSESDATLRFVHRDNTVWISSSYSQGRIGADVSYAELRVAATAFLEAMLGDLYGAHPELKSNPEMEMLERPPS